jgi:hypothetical protein
MTSGRRTEWRDREGLIIPDLPHPGYLLAQQTGWKSYNPQPTTNNLSGDPDTVNVGIWTPHLIDLTSIMRHYYTARNPADLNDYGGWISFGVVDDAIKWGIAAKKLKYAGLWINTSRSKKREYNPITGKNPNLLLEREIRDLPRWQGLENLVPNYFE